MGEDGIAKEEESVLRSKDPLPTNPYGLGGQFIRTIGKYATIVFLIVFIVIGLVMVGFYGFYKFNEQYTKGKKVSDEQYRKRLNDMNKIIDNRFAEINKFSGEQIDNVSNIFALHKKLRESIDAAEKAAKDEIGKTELKSQALLKEKEQKFNDDITNKKQLIEKMRIDAEDEKEKLSILRKEHEKKKKALDEKSKNVSMNLNEIFTLRKQRDELAKTILKIDKRFVNEDTYAMAREIQKNFFPENKTNPIVNWLNDYAINPSSDTTNNLREKLVGFGTSSLEEAIKIQNNLKIKTWFKLSIFSGRNDQELYYLGAKSFDEYGYKDIVFISTSLSSSDKGPLIPKIEDVNCGRFLRIISIPNPENWYELYSYILVSDFNESDPVIEEVDFLVPESKWGMEQFLTVTDSDIVRINVLPLGDSFNQKFDQITYSMLENKHHEFYKMLVADSYEGFADSINMLKKSNEFVPPGHDNKHLSKLPRRLQESFAELLVSTVRKDGTNIGKLIPNYDLAGEIAAIALKNDFRVVGVQPVYQATQSQIQQMPIPSIEDQNPDANKYLIFARYQISVHDKDEGSVMFLFERSLSEFGWRLAEFNENYYGNEELR